MRISRTIVLFTAGWVVFALAACAPSWLAQTSLRPAFDAHPTLAHFITKTLLVLFVVGAVLLDRQRTWADYGFRRAVRKVAWWTVGGVGALLGAAATTAILLTPARGMTFLREFGFLGMVLSVWLYSSLTEEIFVRGWFQTAVADERSVALRQRALSGAVVASAFFFGSMHLTLFFRGADVLTALIIVPATTLLGLAAAIFRERYKCLLPAFVTHVAFNVGGVAAGVVVNVIALVATGKAIQK